MNNSLHYSISGSGFPVLFLHGFLEDSSMWDYLIIDPIGIQQIRIDLHGHGKSISQSSKSSIKQMAFDVMELMHFIGLTQFHMVGHSMGAYVALEIHNLLLFKTKLILLNSNFWSDSVKKQRDRERVVSLLTQNKKLFISTALPSLFLDSNRFKREITLLASKAILFPVQGLIDVTYAMRDRVSFSDYVFLNKDSIFIIQGEFDTSSSLEKMNDELRCKKNFFVINDIAHMSFIENAKEVNKLLAHILH